MRQPTATLRVLVLAAGVLATTLPSCSLGGKIAPEAGLCERQRWSHLALATKLVDKVDLLLVIDNSASMHDLEAELGNRIPELITKLTDQTRDPITGRSQGIVDLHVAIITTSIGSFGTSICDSVSLGGHMDDRGHLLPRLDVAPLGKAIASAPLAWVFDPARAPSDRYLGAPGASAIAADTTLVAQSVGDDGCRYAAPLEAMYHFLIDPAPYASAKVDCTLSPAGTSCTDPSKPLGRIVRSGRDDVLLAERAAFMRDDSLVAIVMLTDKDDASLKPVDANWIPWAYGPGKMPRGWDACATSVPDDQEPDDSASLLRSFGCTSCFLDPGNPSCKPPASLWPTSKLNVDFDGPNLRGVQQVAKYGFNFLWSRDRYVSGLTSNVVIGSDGKSGPNALYKSGFRTPELVLFAPIVGVPEDLVAGPDHRPKRLDWSAIAAPCTYKGEHCMRDPRMVQSVPPRTLLYKGGGDLSASDPARGGNGGDRNIVSGDDLQYACIQQRTSTPTNDDCSDATTAASNPVCVRNADGTFTQQYFKAYPSLRILRVAQSLGVSSIASICAASYSPALEGLFAAVKANQGDPCLATPITPEPTGEVACRLVETFAREVGPKGETSCEKINGGATAYCTPGKAPCRVEGSRLPPVPATDAAACLAVDVVSKDSSGSSTVESVAAVADPDGNVYATSRTGERHLLCEEVQLTGAAAAACRADPRFAPTSGGGWCYATESAVVGPLCTSAGAIKLKGLAAPHRGSTVSLHCLPGSK